MSNKKKVIVMSSLVLLLAITTYRSERTETRNEELVQLDSVIALYDEGDEKYEEATEMKMEIVAAMEKELVLENMVKSLGFSDAVVSVSSDSDNVNVFINSAELTYDTALSIYSMMKNETGVLSGNIIIVPVYAES